MVRTVFGSGSLASFDVGEWIVWGQRAALHRTGFEVIDFALSYGFVY